MSTYGVFFGTEYLSVFSPKIRARKNLFGHFPRRVTYYRTFGMNVEFYGQCRGVIRYLLNSINGTFCENSSQYFVSNFFPESFHHPDF